MLNVNRPQTRHGKNGPRGVFSLVEAEVIEADVTVVYKQGHLVLGFQHT